MKTGIIVALSCAFALLAFQPARAAQCESGQANVEFEYQRIVMGGGAEKYVVTGFGRSALDFSDIPDVDRPGGLKLHVAVDSLPPATLELHAKSPQWQTLEFRPWRGRPAPLWVEVPGNVERRLPFIKFSDERRFGFAFGLEIWADKQRDWDSPTAKSIRVYLESKDSDGNYVTVFDTRTPCKE